MESFVPFLPVLPALVGAAALIFARQQLKLNRENQRETIAKTLYREYLKIALERPKFANPGLANIDFRKRTFDGSQETFEQYEWFVSYMLHACEEVLRISDSDGWKSAIKRQVSYHAEYLNSSAFADEALVEHYSDEIVDLMPIEANVKTLRGAA
jgi:hypothetical protein